MSKAIQVYDDAKEKVVDIPEDEVENITDMMRVFTGIQEVWYLCLQGKDFRTQLYFWALAICNIIR